MKKKHIILIHCVYWLVYLSIVSLLFLIILQVSSALTSGNYFYTVKNLMMISGIAVIPAFLSFHISYFYLFKTFLTTKKITKLILFGLISSFGSSLIGLLFMSAVVGELFWLKDGIFTAILILTVFQFIPLIHIALALGMKGFFSWFGERKQNELLKQKNYETELALIQTQLNPHFLFNTLNNIDVLIGKNPEMASEYLNKLSEILRFMLYETSTEKIPLAKELAYIQKYVALQKIRTKKDDFVQFKIEGEQTNLDVPPLLFIPFIENAFKYVDRFAEGNAIDIFFEIHKDKIIFLCQNKYVLASKSQVEESGLGMEIIQKRLDLIYGANFSLEIDKLENLYRVKLILNL